MAKRFCTTCGSIGEPKSHTPGKLWVEVVLWLCLLVPGLLYSLWRLNGRRKVCAHCGAQTLVPVDSPVARKARAALEA